MSTSASLMLSMSTSIVQDVLNEMFKVNISGKKGVTYGRLAMLVITVISAAFALNPNSDILTMGAKTFGCFGAVFTPVILFGLRWRRTTKYGAFASMWGALVFIILTEGASFLFGWQWPVNIFFFDNVVWAIFISILLFVIVSCCSKPEIRDYLPPTRKLLKERANISAP